jgi:hypothetical protein
MLTTETGGIMVLVWPFMAADRQEPALSLSVQPDDWSPGNIVRLHAVDRRIRPVQRCWRRTASLPVSRQSR